MVEEPFPEHLFWYITFRRLLVSHPKYISCVLLNVTHEVFHCVKHRLNLHIFLPGLIRLVEIRL